MEDEEILGLREKVIDVFLEWTPTCQDGDSMLVETSPEFGEKYRCVLTPVVVSSKGKVTARIQVFNLNTDPIVIPGEVVMRGLEPVKVMVTLKKEEHPGEVGCFDSCKRVQCGIKPTWPKGTMPKSKSWLAHESQ